MTQISTAPPQAPPAPVLSGAGLFAVLLATTLSTMDAFIVNVALPSIGAELGADPAALELVVAGYATSYAALMVLGGRLGDAHGRRRMMVLGLIGFGAASLLCGLAVSPAMLVAARVAQGAAAALLLPQGMATIQATTSGPQRARAMGLFGATVGLALAFGQILGGLLVAADVAGTGWRAAFLINVPVVAVAAVLLVRSVPDTRSERPAPPDPLGALLLGAAMVLLLAPLTEGRAAGWPAWSWICLAAFPVAAGAFLATQRRAERSGRVPLLPPSLLALPGMRRGVPVMMLSMAGFSGFLFTAAVSLQNGLGLGPVAAGCALVPYALAFFASSTLGPRLAPRLGGRAVTIGIGVQVAGLVSLVWTVASSWSTAAPATTVLWLAPSLAVVGFGQGMHLPVLFRVVLADVPPERAGVGSGAMGTSQQIAMASGLALLGALFLHLEPGLGIGEAFAWTIAAQTLSAAVNLGLSLRLRD
ncbi:MFS transporter [Glycomyces albidus]|uniref:MFS transporter n=1 Tax=Glycomyces albidus TaxID=2656774 RepID=A0A6L5G8H2_9ACTN|nr:MFS transporter [Glycomyces albidus]MQM25920.1 MFS transporter [Glycomyces albidus]